MKSNSPLPILAPRNQDRSTSFTLSLLQNVIPVQLKRGVVCQTPSWDGSRARHLLGRPPPPGTPVCRTQILSSFPWNNKLLLLCFDGI